MVVVVVVVVVVMVVVAVVVAAVVVVRRPPEVVVVVVVVVVVIVIVVVVAHVGDTSSNNTRNNGRGYVEVAIARQLRLPAVMARGRAGRWPGAPRGKWRAHGIMRNAEGRINATAIRRIIMFLNLTGPHRRVAGVRAVVAPHWPPPRPTGAGRAPARGSLARISMNPLPALPVVAHALIFAPANY